MAEKDDGTEFFNGYNPSPARQASKPAFSVGTPRIGGWAFSDGPRYATLRLDSEVFNLGDGLALRVEIREQTIDGRYDAVVSYRLEWLGGGAHIARIAADALLARVMQKTYVGEVRRRYGDGALEAASALRHAPAGHKARSVL